MRICAQRVVIDTPPSPNMYASHRSEMQGTPKSLVRRQILNSPAFYGFRSACNDQTELTMSPLQLTDSPACQPAAPLTPSSAVRSSPRRKQTSTPGKDGAAPTVSSNKNQAFLIESNGPTFSKAKRRLIEEPSTLPAPSFYSSNSSGNAAKRIKITHKPSITRRPFSSQRHRRYGSINAGVGHKIRRPKPGSKKVNIMQRKVPQIAEIWLDPSLTSIKHLQVEKESAPPSPATLTSSPKPNEFVALKEVPATSNTPETARKPEKKLEIVPKVITRNWNHGYRETKERRFFKSKASHPERLQNRVVTVSVNENLKLQIREQPSPKSPRKVAKSPRKTVKSPWKVSKSPRKIKHQFNQPPPVVSFDDKKSNVEIAVDLLQQDWDDAGDAMDISSNIQQILDGLSRDEQTSDVVLPAISPIPDATSEKGNEATESAAKLFPLFYKDAFKAATTPQHHTAGALSGSTTGGSSRYQWLKARADGDGQRILDAGQKAYGAVQCPECSLVYHVKEPEDELLHAKIHDSTLNTLKFAGWKKERLVRRCSTQPDGQILAVYPGDAAHCWNKVENILKNVVDNELGFSEVGIRRPEATRVYLYITEKKVVGMLVAESIGHGYRVLAAGRSCSSEPMPVVCGVSRIWTLASYRRKKVASQLVDAMRSDFVYGKYLEVDEIAFSDPTENGMEFSRRYTKRNDFLVYNM